MTLFIARSREMFCPGRPGIRLSPGGAIHDLGDPMSKMLFTMLAVFAEFEADLLKMRTRPP